MSPRELLSRVPSAQRLHRIGVLLSILASVALVAWTLSLARSISGVFEHQPLTPALLGLAGFLALRIGFRFASAQLLATSSSRLRVGVRSALTTYWGAEHSTSTSTGVDSTLLGPGIDSLDDYITKYLPARSLATVIPLVVFLTIGILDPWTLLILLFAGPMLILLLDLLLRRPVLNPSGSVILM